MTLKVAISFYCTAMTEKKAPSYTKKFNFRIYIYIYIKTAIKNGLVKDERLQHALEKTSTRNIVENKWKAEQKTRAKMKKKKTQPTNLLFFKDIEKTTLG